MKPLDDLRNDLREVDRELLKLIARRQEIALDIGKSKLQTGLSTRDFSQEKNVLQRTADEASRLKLSPDLAQKIMLLLIDASLSVQEQDAVSVRAEGTGRRVLVIGGAGKMGRWMARFLDSQGFEVEIADPEESVEGYHCRRTWSVSDLDHDIIVVATPLRETSRILDKMAVSPPTGLIFDIGSLKSPLKKGLLALADAGARVTSVHPMFGPDTELLSQKHVIFVDVGAPAATREARELFASTMATQVEMDLDSHDRLVAYILGLSHVLNIAFATALAESGETAHKLAELSSTTFDAQLEIAAQVMEENPHLYFEIQTLNDYGMESITALLYALERIRSIVRSEDEAAFVKLLKSGGTYLRGTAAVRSIHS